METSLPRDQVLPVSMQQKCLKLRGLHGREERSYLEIIAVLYNKHVPEQAT